MLDTDHISLHQRENLTIAQRIAMVDASQLSVSIVTVEEQMRGWLDRIRQAKTSEELVMAYDRLKITTQDFSGIQILNFDLTAHNHLKSQGS